MNKSEAYIENGIFDEKGLGQVVVCRRKASGIVEAGVFMVDVWCLGVKNAFFSRFDTEEEFQNALHRMFRGDIPKPEPAANGRKLVEDAVAYAMRLGFSPHSHYKKGARVFGGINPKESTASYTFGKDGKPFYIQGPNDNPTRILAILQRRFGPDGFHFLAAQNTGAFSRAMDEMFGN